MSQSACSQWNNGHSDAGQIVFCHETSAELLIETRCVRHRASPTTECDRVHFSCTCSALPTGKQHLNEPSSLQWLTDRSGMENRAMATVDVFLLWAGFIWSDVTGRAVHKPEPLCTPEPCYPFCSQIKAVSALSSFRRSYCHTCNSFSLNLVLLC